MLWPGTAGCDRAKKPREGTGSFSCWWQGQTHCENRPLWSPGARARCLSLQPRANQAQLLPGPCSNLTVSLTDIPQIHVRLVSPHCCPWKMRGRPRQGGHTDPQHSNTAPASCRDPAHPETQIHCGMLSAKQGKGGGPCTAQGSLPTGPAGRHWQQECPDPPRELKGAAGVAKSPSTSPSTRPGSGGRLTALHDTGETSEQGNCLAGFNQSVSPALQLHGGIAGKCGDGTGEPGTSQSVRPGRADINSPHRELGTDLTPARAATAPPWAHGQGRFSSEQV